MNYKTDIEPIITAGVRHAITVSAGWLAAQGVIAQDQQTQTIQLGTSIVLGLIGVGWAFWQKTHQKAQVKEAAATGIVPGAKQP